MATKKTAVRNTSRNGSARSERDETPSRAVPQGYKKRTNEVVGFWDPAWDGSEDGVPPPAELHIHFTPRSARAFDNKTDKLKNSVLIQGESIGVNTLRTADGEVFECVNGDTIGVWYKPGMSDIKNLRNVPVYMYPTGTRDTGKPKPMVTFDVTSPKTGDQMVIDDDYRKESAHTKLPFDVRSAIPSDTVDAPF